MEIKKQEIFDSISYAQRIQNELLPSVADVTKAFPKSFILYKPKDIVSGDFYWFYETSPKSKVSGTEAQLETLNLELGTILIAACDCTGHGVPGAFMSTIGTEKLNEAVLSDNDVSAILKSVNIRLKKVLHQTEEGDSTRDGMDIVLCSFNKEMTKVEYAGANRPLWIVRGIPPPSFKEGAGGWSANRELVEIKATKVAVGGLTDDEQDFTKHSIDLKKGDTLYLFTDGFSDQYSPEDKKLMTRKFKEILLSIQDKSMDEQREHLDTFIENWKGNMEQTDDILVIGVRV